MGQIVLGTQATTPGTPAAGYGTIFIDNSGNLCRLDSSGNLLKLAAAGSFTLTVPGTGTVALLGSANTFTSTNTFNSVTTLAHARTRSDTINDDAAVSFTPASNVGMCLVVVTTNVATYSGIVIYRAASSPSCDKLVGPATLLTGTTALTGTTGADGNLNVAAASDGTFYIENRTGSSRTVRTTFLS